MKIGIEQLVLSFLLLFLGACLNGQTKGRNPGHLEYENYTIADGFPSYNPKKMVQDDNGFIWIAAVEGLIRYDGYNFKLFKPDSENPFNNIIENLALTVDGKILCPGWNNFRFFEPKTETFQSINYTLPAEKRAPAILDILEDHLGNIWIATYQGIRIILKEAKQFQEVISLNSLYQEAGYSSIIQKASQLSTDSTIKLYDLSTTDSSGLISMENHDNEYVLISLAEFGKEGKWESFGWLQSEQGDTLWFPQIEKSVSFQRYLNRLFITRIKLPPGKVQLKYVINSPTANRPLQGRSQMYSNWWGLHLIPIEKLNTGNFLKEIDVLSQQNTTQRWLSGQSVTSLYKDSTDRIYVGTNRGMDIFSQSAYGSRIDSFPYPFVKHFQFTGLSKGSLSSFQVLEIYNDGGKNIWLAGFNPMVNSGQPFIIESFDPELEVFRSFQTSIPSKPRVENPFLSYYPKDMVRADNGSFWLSAAHSGLFRISITKDTFNQKLDIDHFLYDFTPTTGPLMTHDILEDKNNNIWVATNDNYIFKLNSGSKKIGYTELPKTFPDQSSEGKLIIGDKTGKIWITNNLANKAFCYDPNADQFLSVGIPPCEVGSLQVMMDDQEGNIWFGSQDGSISKYHPESKEFKRIKVADRGATYPYFQDNEGLIWVADLQSNLYRLDPETSKLNLIPSIADSSSMERRAAPFFMYPHQDTIYIGYRGGLGLLTQEKEKEENKFKFQEILRLNDVYAAVKDYKNRLWVGTFLHGVLLFDKNHNVIRSFKTEDGLLNNNIIGLFPDTKKRLWIHSLKGIQSMDLQTLKLASTNHLKDLAANNYLGESYQNKEGTFFVTQGEKVYYFNLDSIEIDSTPPNTILQDFLIVDSNKGTDSLINVTYLNQIGLNYTENTIAISYAGIHYNNPKEHLYAHRLVGLNNDWQEVGKERVARYNKLPPGKYTFEVKAANSDGVWTDDPTTLQITILPPWFWNAWSKSLYAVAALGLLFFLYQFQLNRQLAVAEAQRLTELDTVKTQLYTNITHEFRTPLTVISGMADEVLENPQKWFREGLEMIKRNSGHLLQLVNQLLDLSKLESGSLKVSMVQDDMVAYLKYLVESFQSFAQSKDIQLSIISKVSALSMDLDPTKTQSICSNLLSNAIKFTPNGGVIQVEIDEIPSPQGQSYCQIRISDNGPGIPEEALPYIFDRFYQADNTTTRQAEGTGVGLALTKELVEILQGEIEVDSRTKVGTTFTIKLPIHKQAKPTDARALLAPISEHGNLPRLVLDNPTVAPPAEQPSVLLVEDNADVLQYLTSCLADQYKLTMALNGQEGIDKAIETIPDIIISDVMMPEKDGIELLQALKNDERTSHIPIVMLTAKADIQSKIEGLEQGADAYLAKPFYKAELLVRLKKLIELRKVLQLRYQNLTPDSTTINKTIMKEDAFLLKVRRSVESHISDENFGIAELCDDLAISRTQLHRKLTAVTGKSTSYVVRSIRLKKAKTLLQSTDLNVSEVGYEVGYANSSHFAQDFRKEFGQAPSKFKKK